MLSERISGRSAVKLSGFDIANEYEEKVFPGNPAIKPFKSILTRREGGAFRVDCMEVWEIIFA